MLGSQAPSCGSGGWRSGCGEVFSAALSPREGAVSNVVVVLKRQEGTRGHRRACGGGCGGLCVAGLRNSKGAVCKVVVGLLQREQRLRVSAGGSRIGRGISQAPATAERARQLRFRSAGRESALRLGGRRLRHNRRGVSVSKSRALCSFRCLFTVSGASLQFQVPLTHEISGTLQVQVPSCCNGCRHGHRFVPELLHEAAHCAGRTLKYKNTRAWSETFNNVTLSSPTVGSVIDPDRE